MNKIFKVKNVKKFIINDDELYYYSNDKIFRDNKIIMHLENNFFGDFFVNQGNIIIQDFYGNIKVNNVTYKGYYNYLNYKSISYLNSEENIIYLIENNKKYKLNLHQMYYDLGNAYTIDVNNKTHLHAYTLPTAEPLWQFDLGILGEYETYKGEIKSYIIEKFIGAWRDELLVACSNGLILCLDINTGIEKRRWQELEGYYPKVQGVANKLPRTENFILDPKTNSLIALHIFSMVIIDLITGNIKVIDMEKELRQININLLKNNSSYGINDTHIFTTATMDYSDNKSQWTYDCLIAINRKTYEIDWQYKFEDEGLGTNTPQLSENKLYQLTSLNTLYIFEKVQ